MSSADTPIDVVGYETDPLRRGYQQLFNYESTYWRALVGNDAWSLYEVLRSFCHKGANTCNPSINLLLAILGIKDRSVLIGRTKPKIVKGKAYHYPGLIEVLQQYNLVTAEEVGEGHRMRYIFHVEMTPPMLSPNQLEQLPEVLQKKHSELLERCRDDKRKLTAKKRKAKLQAEQAEPGVGNSNTLESEDTLGNSNTPLGNSEETLGNSNTPSGNFQGEQQPSNSTHPNSTHENNNTDDLVVALINQGMTKQIAFLLVQNYNRERIEEKLDFLAFRLSHEADKLKNPAGLLRKMIEGNWAAPPSYTADWYQRYAAEKQELERYERLIDERTQARMDRVSPVKNERLRRFESMLAQYDTEEAEFEQLEYQWQEIYSELKTQGKPYEIHLAGSALVRVDLERVVLAVTSSMAKEWLEHRLISQLTRVLARHFGDDVSVEIVALPGME